MDPIIQPRRPEEIDECRRRGHTIWNMGIFDACMRCDVRTDQSFALESRNLLSRIRAGLKKEAA